MSDPATHHAPTHDPASPSPHPGLERRAFVVAGALFALAALLTAARLLLGLAALSTASLFAFLPVVALVVTLATSAALWLVSGRRGICAASPAGRVALRIAAVTQLLAAVLALVPTVLAAGIGSMAVLLLTLVSVVAALAGAVLAARSASGDGSGGVRGPAGWALVAWAVVALVRTVVFSTPIGFALGASSITAFAFGGQVLTVLALLVVAVTWLVAGLRFPAARA
ncbi:hypothetical protein ES689_12470 [Frigoribacterium sp. ACAM 257]|uniref:hypothetical protein n=1 Tax=Frigoribacterium sp. ACAM 257 TaxID=2508998 RepID=UPI0011B9D899|nr:hypothetical protein [Frigoribacterium sp. ACAM 257]TWX36215.1 hypothetical protein ES689_12470 [Frigoribacterium sp. ACAM 257]